jgi:hypothetical protein
MEQAADYLYNVALAAVTFMGFSTVFVTFREALGGQMVEVRCRAHPQHPVLRHHHRRLSAAASPPSARRPARPGRAAAERCDSRPAGDLQPDVSANPARGDREAHAQAGVYRSRAGVAAAALLAANAIGAPVGASLALHAVGITTTLVATFVAFLFGLDLLPTEPARNEQTQEQSRPRKGRRRAG